MNYRQLKMILCNWRHLNTSRRPRMQQLKLMLVVMLAIALFTLAYQAANVLRPEAPIHRDPPQQLPNYVCHSCGSACEPNLLTDVHSSERPDYQQQEELKATDDRVLVLVETLYSPLGKEICDILNALKLPYKAEPLGKNLPLLTTATRGRFALIIIENYYKYLNLVEWNRQLLDKYCVDYSVALIGFLTTRPKPTFVKSKVKGAALTLYQKQRVRNLTFSVGSSVPFIARRGQVLPLPEPDEADWVVFQGQHNSTYESVLVADVVYDDEEPLKPYNMAAVMLDRGEEDGIRRVLLGQKLNHWLVKLSFIDAIRHLTNGRLGMPLERYLQVDIDDIFVGQVGRRMIADDVLALIESQKRMREMVPGFTYNLGFSGKYFLNGDDLEDQGDTLLVEQASQFVWFPHMWRHNHAHRHNLTYLEAIMTQNRLFAEMYKLPIMYNYSVAPHHAGVYPVHEPLFEAWRRVWKIRVTCTEEYPHFRPASRRRGFVYKGIMVLPRQTCGLYTHTLLFSAYPGGHAALTKSIQGGEIFFSIIYNPFALFMTHQQNYGNDRLAIYTFENAVRFVNCWTNIKLKWMDPLKMGIAYFQRFPDERTPVWGNPCSDPRHLEILSSDFNCSQLALPNAVIVGPQKTGSTALYAFLKLHPNVQSNVENNVTYEEPQFFGGKAYLNGLDWYLNQFPFDSGVEGQQVLFEKSATYFDSPDAPRQMNALIDEAKLIIILINPAKRAYSWYQHMIAHKDPIALKYSFAQVLAATDNDSERKLWKLRQRCIAPGRYAHHLDRWLEYYSPNRLLIVDGEQLKDDPVPVMNDVQQFLGLPLIDYKQLLKFNEHKGFYCSQAEGNKTKCLGKSKGRGYEPMGAELTDSLAKLYLQDNIALHKMITKMGWRTPRWLQEQLVKLS